MGMRSVSILFQNHPQGDMKRKIHSEQTLKRRLFTIICTFIFESAPHSIDKSPTPFKNLAQPLASEVTILIVNSPGDTSLPRYPRPTARIATHSSKQEGRKL